MKKLPQPMSLSRWDRKCSLD